MVLSYKIKIIQKVLYTEPFALAAIEMILSLKISPISRYCNNKLKRRSFVKAFGFPSSSKTVEKNERCSSCLYKKTTYIRFIVQGSTVGGTIPA
jgi:hypothetical protein